MEGVDRGPLLGLRIPVAELGRRSFFVPGTEAQRCVVGGQYRLNLQHGSRSIVCTTECVRIENTPRIGAAFRLLPDEREALALLLEVLQAK